MTDETRKSASPSGGGYEKQDVNLLKIALFGILGIIILIIVVILLVNYFTLIQEQVIYQEVLRPESSALRDLRVRETEELNSFAVLDSAKGLYRIPVERAMALLADEAFQTATDPRQEDR